MDELIAKALAGEASDIDARTVERWRAAHPENERSYRDAERVWRLSEALRSDAVAGPAPSARELLDRAEARRRRARASAGRRALLRSPWTGYGLAAAAALALVMVRIVAPDGSEAVPLLAPVESTSSGSEAVTMRLSDGSVLRMSGSSSVDFPAVADRREVVLAGRAFFAVAEDEAPFVVRTALGDVTVTGTRFEVSVSDAALRLVVVEGSVLLEGAGWGVTLSAGQAAHVVAGGLPSLSTPDDVWSLLDWQGGLLLFHATPLEAVAGEVGRHFGVEVTVAEELAERRITAWFGDEPLGDVAAAVCLVAGATCEVGETNVRIGR